MTVGVELIFANLPAQRVAVNPQDFSGAGLVAVFTVQHPLDKTLLKFADRFVEQNSTLHHLINEPFQLILHDGARRRENSWVGPVC